MPSNAQSAPDYNERYPAILALDKLHLQLSLGVSQQERSIPQSVHLYVKIFFPKIPSSCLNDKLDDTICYDKLVQHIKTFCYNKEFKLLEYVCFQIHAHLRETIDPALKLWLKIEKCNVPIAELEGGSSFSYGDL
jgi:FolB domain-containing protein